MGDTRLYPATAMPDREWWAALWPDPGAVLRRLGLGPGQVSVDLCCGDGWFTAALVRLTGARVYAVDLDPDMLARARAEVAAAGGGDVVWIEAEAAEALASHVAAPVDAVLLANTFHGVPDPTGLARAVAAALAPGGRFIVINWQPLPREETPVLGQPRGPRTDLRQSPEAVQAAVTPAGLRPVTVEPLPPYHYGAVFERPPGGAAQPGAAGR